jgi:hypothetical protein
MQSIFPKLLQRDSKIGDVFTEDRERERERERRLQLLVMEVSKRATGISFDC